MATHNLTPESPSRLGSVDRAADLALETVLEVLGARIRDRSGALYEARATVRRLEERIGRLEAVAGRAAAALDEERRPDLAEQVRDCLADGALARKIERSEASDGFEVGGEGRPRLTAAEVAELREVLEAGEWDLHAEGIGYACRALLAEVDNLRAARLCGCDGCERVLQAYGSGPRRSVDFAPVAELLEEVAAGGWETADGVPISPAAALGALAALEALDKPGGARIERTILGSDLEVSARAVGAEACDELRTRIHGGQRRGGYRWPPGLARDVARRLTPDLLALAESGRR